MKSLGFIALAACGVLSVAAVPQQTYDGRNGPHVFGPPGNQIYIRGQNEGRYNVPGVGGQFENAPSRGEHIYTDEQGNTFVNRKNAGGPASHSISGPTLSAQNPGPARLDGSNGGLNAAAPPRRSRQIHIARPDRTVDIGYGGVYVQRSRRSPQDEYNGNFPIFIRRRRSPQDEYNGNFPILIRRRRGINDARVQGQNFVARENQAGVWDNHVSVWKRPDGRTVTLDQNGNAIVSGRRGTQRYS